VNEPQGRPTRPAETPERRTRRAWWIFAVSFFVLGLIALLRLGIERARPIDYAVLGLVVVVGFAAIRHRQAVATLEVGRREEAESFARILSSLSRSVSPDAILGAIVGELAGATGADHIVIARRRPDARVLEATLISARPGVPDSHTRLPIGDLEDPIAGSPARAARGPVAIPIVAEIADPVAVGGMRGRFAPGQQQMIAERIAAGAGEVYGLANTLAAPLAVGWQRHRGHRPLAPDRRCLVADHAAAPQRRGARGVVGPVASLFAPGGRGAGLDRRADRPPEPALFRRVLRTPGAPPSLGRCGRRPDDRHRQIQGPQRRPRPRHR